jgi:hypothetical protein
VPPGFDAEGWSAPKQQAIHPALGTSAAPGRVGLYIHSIRAKSKVVFAQRYTVLSDVSEGGQRSLWFSSIGQRLEPELANFRSAAARAGERPRFQPWWALLMPSANPSASCFFGNRSPMQHLHDPPNEIPSTTKRYVAPPAMCRDFGHLKAKFGRPSRLSDQEELR